MKAMVFAAGLGTRLKPFTDYHPKALAEVCGKPMLGRVIEKLKDAGVDEIVVNVHHFADQIVEYIGKNDNFGITIHISDETDKLLDTGGGILAARDYFEGAEPFIVHNADILTDFDLHSMYDFAVSSGLTATLLVSDRKTKRYLLFDRDDMRMHGWTNIETGEVRPAGLQLQQTFVKRAFGGVHIISPDLFPALEAYAKDIDSYSIPKFSITDFYIAACGDMTISGYEPAGPYRWHDIGKPESLAEAQTIFCV